MTRVRPRTCRELFARHPRATMSVGPRVRRAAHVAAEGGPRRGCRAGQGPGDDPPPETLPATLGSGTGSGRAAKSWPGRFTDGSGFRS